MRSLRARLFGVWALSLAASLVVGVLLVRLYGQSSSALEGEQQGRLARACDTIAERYTYYMSNGTGPLPALSDAGLQHDLRTAVTIALARSAQIEGGIWQSDQGPLAFVDPADLASPLPADQQTRIEAVNAAADQAGAPVLRSFGTRSQSTLVYACPLRGPIGSLTAWTMTRVDNAAGYSRLLGGLGVLLVLVLAMSVWLTWLVAAWTRHVQRIENALAEHAAGSLPLLAPTGERELDRIISALNTAGARVTAAQTEASALAGQVAASERLAALGRVAAGMAHEIRNPIAAIRLRAENGLAGDDARRQTALDAILAQVARVDRLIAELLAMTQGRQPVPEPVDLHAFLFARGAEHRASAQAAGVALLARSELAQGWFDPGLVARAIDNLVQNAIRHTPPGGVVLLSAMPGTNGALHLSVSDTGPGVPPDLRGRLFEPFVTGRADGTGLGLAIAREMAQAHGGHITLSGSGSPGIAGAGSGAVFTIELPQGHAACPAS